MRLNRDRNKRSNILEILFKNLKICFVILIKVSHNGPNRLIQACWSLRHSEFFTVTRQLASLNCAAGGGRSLLLPITVLYMRTPLPEGNTANFDTYCIY